MDATTHSNPTLGELLDAWPSMDAPERAATFAALDDEEATDLFLALSSSDQASFLADLPAGARRLWARLLAPDDAVDVAQALEGDAAVLLDALDAPTRAQVQALLAYREDEAGGLMDPRYAVLRPEFTVDEAIAYLRRQYAAREDPTYYTYVLGTDHRLVGVVTMRELIRAAGRAKVQEIMTREVLSVREDADQEEVARMMARYDFLALPVVDADGRMKGVVTVDDAIDVMTEEATEDIQKLGGTEALDAPYLQVDFFELLKKRAGWLTVLFVGEMLTATAMAYFEDAIAKAVVLALFIPLIISSGGNAGSQATTLIVRALGVGDVRMEDALRVLRREVLSGLALGFVLALIGFLRIVLWPTRDALYGPHYLLIAAAVSLSVVGVVAWGTISGAMLPFLLRRLRLDPATASAPMVATLVDVTGLVIYFSVASAVLRGTLL